MTDRIGGRKRWEAGRVKMTVGVSETQVILPARIYVRMNGCIIKLVIAIACGKDISSWLL